MADLTSKQRNSLSSSTFGLPGQRKYPMNDKSHARNALARASQQFNRGNLSSSAKSQIDAKAHRILGRKADGDIMGSGNGGSSFPSGPSSAGPMVPPPTRGGMFPKQGGFPNSVPPNSRRRRRYFGQR